MNDSLALWWIALALAVVVTGVVAVLLAMIVTTATDIERGVEKIWVRGQQVANNTIHIPILHATGDAVARILGAAGGILGASQSIAAHASGCPGCPMCIRGEPAVGSSR